jgi:4-amino-4-deoxy-L-arabinose transferase-like glycosyltransferase
MDVPSGPAAPGPRTRWGLVAAGLVLLFSGFLYARTQDLDAGARDQAHDLALALEIREGRALTDGNRHPLLPAALAPFAAREPSFFVRARLVTLALVAAGLLATWAATAGVFGGGLALFALAISLFEVRLQARRVCPEPILAALLVLAVAALARAPSAARPARGYLAAGALAGLAWLAKGSAILMLPVFALHLLVSRRPGRVRSLLLVLAGFVVVASPLLVWNAATHGSPIHNANTAHVAWEDRWDEDLDDTSTATLSSWWAAHGLGDAISRLFGGLVRQRGIEWPAGFLLLSLLAWSTGRIPHIGVRPEFPRFADSPSEWHRIAVWTCLVWWPAFAWYAPIVSSRRLLFPIVPLLIPPALAMVAAFAPALARGVRVPRGVVVGAALLFAAGGGALAVRAGLPDPARHIPRHAARLAASLPLAKGETIRVLARPSRTIPPDWLFPAGYVLVGLPRSVADGDVAAWMSTHAELLLVSEGLSRNRPGAFLAFAHFDDALGLIPVASWETPMLVEKDARGRSVYMLFPVPVRR